MLFFAERKASKEPQASGLTVSAAGSGSVAAIKDVSARSAMSRRMVIAETPNSLDSAVMRTAPRVRKRLKIKCWRCDEII